VNGHYIRSESLERITDLAIPYLIEADLIDEDFTKSHRAWLEILVDIVREGLHHMSEIVEKVEFIFGNEVNIEDDKALEIVKGEYTETILDAMKVELDKVDEI